MNLCLSLNSDTITNPPFMYNEAVEKHEFHSHLQHLDLNLLKSVYVNIVVASSMQPDLTQTVLSLDLTRPSPVIPSF